MTFDYKRALGEAATIERDLRARGVPAIEIPAILGAAFMGSLTNLPPRQRRSVIAAHVAGCRAVYDDTMRASQAPDGPMPDLTG